MRVLLRHSCLVICTLLYPFAAGAQHASVGAWLAAQGCSTAASLVGPTLSVRVTPWNPGATLSEGPGFEASFAPRYGIAYSERRSPLEVETLVEPYERARAGIEADPARFGLPAGYRLTFTDKTDLFYVYCFGGLALRKVILPLIEQPCECESPDPICHPCEICPKVTCPIFRLSPTALDTLERMTRWNVIGPGRAALLRQLRVEIRALLASSPSP